MGSKLGGFWGRKGLLATIICFLIFLLGFSPTQGGSYAIAQEIQKTVVIKIAHEIPRAGHPKYDWCENFKRIIENKTSGKVRVEIYPSNQLFPSEEATFQGLVYGVIQIAMPASAHLAGTIREFQVFDLPMFFPSQEDNYKFQDSQMGKELLDLVKKKGTIGITYINNAPLDIYSSSVVDKLEDIRGRKIRVHASPTLEASVKALGANPISMPSSELYLAMKQGVIDGFFTTPGSSYTAKYYEVAGCVTLVGISPLVYPVLANINFWNGLSNENKSLITSSAEEATKLNRQRLNEDIQNAFNKMKGFGLKITKLSPEERERWVKALIPVKDKVRDILGRDWVERAEKFSK